MNRQQLENIYLANGLSDYKLRDIEDILKCHGHDCLELKGYETLSIINQEIFKKFIVNLFNASGLMTRTKMEPMGVYFVEDKEYVGEDPDDKECVVMVKHIIKSIDRAGNKKVIHSRKAYEKENRNLPIVEVYTHNYLRFEYKEFGKAEWLHITHEGEEWY